MQELVDPSQALDRARAIWQKQGRSGKWIQQRMLGQEARNVAARSELTSIFYFS